jgi:hypothetical protein
MKIQHLLFLAVAITAVISLVCVSLFPSAQDFMLYNTMWNGVRQTTNDLHTQPITSLQPINQPDSNKILISIPYIQYNSGDMQELKTFLDDGGTLMLMDDFGYGNSVLEYLQVDCRFSGTALLDPLFCYKNQRFPEITDFNSTAVTANVKEVVLNHATGLLNTGGTELLASSSTSSYLDTNGNEIWDSSEPKGPFPVAVKMSFGKGELIVVSDPSILINSMVGKDDNLLFVKNVLEPQIQTVPVLLDTSHLVADPLETTKFKLQSIIDFLSQPYAVLGIIMLLFAAVMIYMLKNGGPIGRKS